MAMHPGRCCLKAVPAFIPRSKQAQRAALALHTTQPKGCLPGILLSKLQTQQGHSSAVAAVLVSQ